MAELLLKWRVRKLTGHCGERSFRACLYPLRIVLLYGVKREERRGGEGRGEEKRGEERRGGEGRGEKRRGGERKGEQRRGEEEKGEKSGFFLNDAIATFLLCEIILLVKYIQKYSLRP